MKTLKKSIKSKQLLLILSLLTLSLTVTTPPTLAQETGQEYTVQRDDSLWKLAEKYLGDGNRFAEIVAATQAKRAEDASFAPISDPSLILSGSKLWIPAPGAAATADEPAQMAQPAAVTISQSGGPGGHIAFSFWNDSPERCTYEIDAIDVNACLTDAATCQVKRRVFSLSNASEPALSPDGNRLAFHGWGGIPEKYEGDTLDHPYFGCSPNPAERRLGATTLDGTAYVGMTHFWEDSHPDWSPDGQRLLFDTNRLDDGLTRLLTVSADGLHEEDLRIAGQQPSWAPDNSRFVYRGCDLTGNRCGLWLGQAVPVQAWEVGNNMLGPVIEAPEAAHPDWSPLGEQIVYQSPVSGSWDLYLINAAGSGKRQLTNSPAIEGLPAWSPDGQWISYLSNEGGNWGLWLMRADGSEQQLLFAFDGGIFTPQAITPYGSRDWLDEQISWSK